MIPFAAPPNAGGGALKLKSTSILYGIMFLALGVERLVVAINKMDLVGYSREVFTREEQKCKQFADHFGSHRMRCIPISALHEPTLMHGQGPSP